MAPPHRVAGALLGSVKSNVGHAQAAAGGLGLAKVLIAAERGAVPAKSARRRGQPRNRLGKTRVCGWPTKLTPWPAADGQRLAAVSAFGMSGTNAHVIVSCPMPEAA